jgi:hypothetical protein
LAFPAAEQPPTRPQLGCPDVYLRSIPALRHQTPEPVPGNAVTVPGALEEEHAWKDYGIGDVTPVR